MDRLRHGWAWTAALVAVALHTCANAHADEPSPFGPRTVSAGKADPAGDAHAKLKQLAHERQQAIEAIAAARQSNNRDDEFEGAKKLRVIERDLLRLGKNHPGVTKPDSIFMGSGIPNMRASSRISANSSAKKSGTAPPRRRCAADVRFLPNSWVTSIRSTRRP